MLLFFRMRNYQNEIVVSQIFGQLCEISRLDYNTNFYNSSYVNVDCDNGLNIKKYKLKKSIKHKVIVKEYWDYKIVLFKIINTYNHEFNIKILRKL